MKTTSASLLVTLLLTIFTQLSAQSNIRVEASSNDISYALDLRAVASIFEKSNNLEEFERQLNNYSDEISNLDLNEDGYIDYLRVVESSERNVHLVVIQAVLGDNFYQDVASIVVEKDYSNKFYVQIIGDPFIYGRNYIIEPYFRSTPYIINWFWSSRYYRWTSPYYWGYYPRYYHYRNPVHIDIYLGRVNTHINFHNHYRYTEHYRNDNYGRIYAPIGRNDYSNRYPDKTFNKRNNDESIRNKHYYENNRNNSNYGRNESQINRSGNNRNDRNNSSNYNKNNRSEESNRNYSYGNNRNNSYQQNSQNKNSNDRNSSSYNRNTPSNSGHYESKSNSIQRPTVDRNESRKSQSMSRSNENQSKKSSDSGSKQKTENRNNPEKSNSRR